MPKRVAIVRLDEERTPIVGHAKIRAVTSRGALIRTKRDSDHPRNRKSQCVPRVVAHSDNSASHDEDTPFTQKVNWLLRQQGEIFRQRREALLRLEQTP